MPSLKDFMNAETMGAPGKRMNSPAMSPHPVRGTGGGLSDHVPAMIDEQQPAALSEGEFVVPADVVSMLGDGSSEAGARILQSLVDKVRTLKAKSGNKQAPALMDLLKPKKKKGKKRG